MRSGACLPYQRMFFMAVGGSISSSGSRRGVSGLPLQKGGWGFSRARNACPRGHVLVKTGDEALIQTGFSYIIVYRDCQKLLADRLLSRYDSR